MTLSIAIGCVLALGALAIPAAAGQSRERIRFDEGWKFALGHASDPSRDFDFADGSWGEFSKTGFWRGPISVGFADSGWRTVDLPHDWVNELPFDPKSDTAHGSKPIGRRYPQNSVGWYRKSFEVPRSDAGRRVKLVFDGVYRDAQVWLNGSYLARNESGYMGFEVDLTDYLRYDQKNTVVVRVNASDFEGWFYEGAGIYRHVWMVKTNATHIDESSVFVQSDVAGENANVTAQLEIRSRGESKPCTLRTELLDADGKAVATATSESQGSWSQETIRFGLAKAHLWSLEDPYLYRARFILSDESGQEIDRYETNFGIRTLRFDAEKGFFLNEKRVVLKGTCNHQDHAGVGAAVPDRVNEFRIEKLKEMGCNAYRTSHNPPTPELLDACDRLGMLVMDETRQLGSSPLQLSELERLVRRDRNHPSVILWSIGNEEGGIQLSAEGARVARTMMAKIHDLDRTRPVTYAGNHGSEFAGIATVVDLRGFNYNLEAMDKYHRDNPQQPVHFSEVASTLCTRGEYANDAQQGFMAAYDLNEPGWGETAEKWWSYTAERPWVAGGFVWTGFDYRGEPTPYGWPCISSHFGILDTCGFPKDNFYYYQAWWTDKPVLHILPHWNWAGKEGQPIDVWVHSNMEEVELFLNGKSLGRKKVVPNHHLEWSVVYQPGKLEARGYRGGKQMLVASQETTGASAAIQLEPDRATIDADGRDVSIFTVKVLDAQGRLMPTASDWVQFKLDGPGRIIGVGNGNPSCHEPDVYVAKPITQALEDWRWLRVTGDIDHRPEVAPNFDDHAWEKIGIERNQPMPPNSIAVLRCSFEVDLKTTPFTHLAVGPIDDVGRVFLNGELIGKTDAWDRDWDFDVAGKLKQGRNVLAIVVENHGGEGGLSGGVRLGGLMQQPDWSRSAFHGLAQVIVQSAKGAGKIHLKATAKGLKPATAEIQAR